MWDSSGKASQAATKNSPNSSRSAAARSRSLAPRSAARSWLRLRTATKERMMRWTETSWRSATRAPLEAKWV